MQQRAQKHRHYLVLVSSLLLLAQPACLPGGGGGGKSTGTNNGQFNNQINNQQQQLGPTTVTLTPPASLTLDDQEVNAGEFVVTEATAYTFGGSMNETTVVSANGEPVVINATIGVGEHELFDVPGATRALAVKGYFDSSEPDLERANFNLTVFGDFSEPIELTVFLPSNTSESANQVTGATRDGEEINIFTDDEIPPEAYESIQENAGDDPGDLDPEDPLLNVRPTEVPMTSHGGMRAQPSVTSANNVTGGDLCPDEEIPQCSGETPYCCVVPSEDNTQCLVGPHCDPETCDVYDEVPCR